MQILVQIQTQIQIFETFAKVDNMNKVVMPRMSHLVQAEAVEPIVGAAAS